MDHSDRGPAPRTPGSRPLPHAPDPAAAWFAAIRTALSGIGPADDYFRRRHRRMADPYHGPRLRALMRYEIGLAGVPIAGADVLDAGCGPGIYAVALAALGARRVLAIDRFPHHVDALAELARRAQLPIEVRDDDAARVNAPDASFDLIYCREAISHFADWAGFVHECVRLLRPRGAVVVSDGNNGANLLVRRRIRAAWLRSERGPFDPATFPPERPLPYLFRRWMMIRRELPGLPDEQLFRLGMHTTTLGGRDLREALRRYAESGHAPSLEYRPGMSVRRPEDGQRDEEPIDPRELARRWRASGLDARVHPHFGFGRGSWLRAVNALARPLAPLAVHVAPAYIVTARRAGAGLAGTPSGV